MDAKIYFSDFFDVTSESLESYGAFNISLINDLPLFIDPFLLFDSKEDQYQSLHEEIIRYVKFLRDISGDESISQGLMDSWFCFPEVSQNWLGFSKTGNKGSGLGKDFARSLNKNLHRVFRDFGTEDITRGSHLEKLCLLADGVGRDHLSDFTTNLIKGYLLEYTQTFARQHIDSSRRKTFAIKRVSFDYKSRRWIDSHFELPAIAGDFVILTPKDMLTKDEAWINRADLLNQFSDIYPSVPDQQLRAQLQEYFLKRLSEDSTKEEIKEAAASTIEKYPAILDYYILDKENSAGEAHQISRVKVRDTEKQFIENIQSLVGGHLAGTEFYDLGNSFEEALRRLHFLKHVIEDNDGYRLFYLKGKPIQREADLQIMYRLTWFASPFDVNREVNNGRGPVDFKIARGNKDKTLVEFKLASNSRLMQNLKHQVGVYEAANETAKSIKAILYFSDSELQKTQSILKDLGLQSRRDVVLIDASSETKVSASKVDDRTQASFRFGD